MDTRAAEADLLTHADDNVGTNRIQSLNYSKSAVFTLLNFETLHELVTVYAAEASHRNIGGDMRNTSIA